MVDVTTTLAEAGRIAHGTTRVERGIVGGLLACDPAGLSFCRFDRARQRFIEVSRDELAAALAKRPAAETSRSAPASKAASRLSLALKQVEWLVRRRIRDPILRQLNAVRRQIVRRNFARRHDVPLGRRDPLRSRPLRSDASSQSGIVRLHDLRRAADRRSEAAESRTDRAPHARRFRHDVSTVSPVPVHFAGDAAGSRGIRKDPRLFLSRLRRDPDGAGFAGCDCPNALRSGSGAGALRAGRGNDNASARTRRCWSTSGSISWRRLFIHPASWSWSATWPRTATTCRGTSVRGPIWRAASWCWKTPTIRCWHGSMPIAASRYSRPFSKGLGCRLPKAWRPGKSVSRAHRAQFPKQPRDRRSCFRQATRNPGFRRFPTSSTMTSGSGWPSGIFASVIGASNGRIRPNASSSCWTSVA